MANEKIDLIESLKKESNTLNVAKLANILLEENPDLIDNDSSFACSDLLIEEIEKLINRKMNCEEVFAF